jgi:hypothetical protein
VNRSAPLRRRTYLKARAPLRPSPLRKVSAKQKARLAAWSIVTLNRMVRVGNKCERCGDGGPTLVRGGKSGASLRLKRLQGHHRLLKSQGGEDTDENCRVLCHECHREVHDNPAESYAAGWMLKRNT